MTSKMCLTQQERENTVRYWIAAIRREGLKTKDPIALGCIEWLIDEEKRLRAALRTIDIGRTSAGQYLYPTDMSEIARRALQADIGAKRDV